MGLFASHIPIVPLACAVAGLLALSGCDRDAEAALKERVDRWVAIGPTTYFESRYGCTAAVYALRDQGFKASIARATNLPDGLRMLAQGRPVAFDIAGITPTEASEVIGSSTLPEALGIMGAAVSAANCMSGEIKRDYLTALNRPGAVLIFDTTDNAVAIADFEGKALYFSGGRN